MRFFSRLFPPPNYLSLPAIGLDISDVSVKYVELSARGGEFALSRFGEIALPEGALASGKLVSPEKVKSTLQTLKDKEKFHFVRATLPEEQVYLFETTIPKAAKDLRGAIELTLEENIPLPAGNVEFDFEIIADAPEGGEVLVAAIDRRIVESYVEILSGAGLVPLSLELEAAALSRSLIPKASTGEPAKNEAVMIVDFGSTRTGISIALDGRIHFSTTTPFGGAYLTDLVAKNFAISKEEAEKMKRATGMQKGVEHRELYSVLVGGVSVLRDEVNKHFIYWHTHPDRRGKPRPKIAKVVFCGGNANLIGLTDYFGSTLRMPVELGDPWVNLPHDSSYVPPMSFAESLAYAPAIGLSSSDLM